MVEIIPKEAPRTPQRLSILFYFSLTLFILSIIALFILNNSIKGSQKTLKNLEEELIKERSAEKIGLRKEILNEQKKFEDFSQLISQHLAVSNFFNFLEKKSHPQVWFSQIEANSKENKVRLTGRAQSFESLGQQVLIFQRENLVQSLELEKISIGKGEGVGFSLVLYFNPQIFSFQSSFNF